MSSTYKTISAEEAAYDGFRQLAKEYRLTNPELLAAMVQYFRVTKADPRQPTGPDLASILAKLGGKIEALDKRTIGFIREQEKQYLKPLLVDVQALHQRVAGPNELRKEQLAEVEQWLVALLRQGFRPEVRNPKLVGAEVPAPKNSPELAPLRQVLRTVIGRELHPTQFVSATPAPAPAGATPPPGSPPTRPA